VTLADGLRGAVGLRNRIAHGYATVDHDRLREEAAEGIAILRDFLVRVADAAGVSRNTAWLTDPDRNVEA
jgi:uncharacterized protein YutE (UPF0331/DUF86 family)